MYMFLTLGLAVLDSKVFTIYDNKNNNNNKGLNKNNNKKTGLVWVTLALNILQYTCYLNVVEN